MSNNNFKISEYWQLKLSSEGIEQVNQWRRWIIKYDDSDASFPHYSHIYEDGSCGHGENSGYKRQEITFSQFEQ